MAVYQRLFQRGELQTRVQQALAILENCHLCPRCCGVNRLAGETGECCTGRQALVSSFGPHYGEETPLVGSGGSGTIFFTYCNLRCCFCQNYAISQLGEGYKVEATDLAEMMLSLQERGCHNINLVSPTHVVPQILEALEIALESGLFIPLVYNSGGFDSVETLRLMDGVIDIYMPDMKYSDEQNSQRFSEVKDYSRHNRAAVREMYRQVGDLVIDDLGVASHGLLVRHLVLPFRLAGTEEICKFLSQEISTNTYLNIMSQYHPCYKASNVTELARSPSDNEFSEAVKIAGDCGLKRLDRIETRRLAIMHRIL